MEGCAMSLTANIENLEKKPVWSSIKSFLNDLLHASVHLKAMSINTKQSRRNASTIVQVNGAFQYIKMYYPF